MTVVMDRLSPDQVAPIVRVAIERVRLRSVAAAPAAIVGPLVPAVIPVGRLGHAFPRIAPPMPGADLAAFHDAAAMLGIAPLPWQDVAASYIEALGPDGKRLYREVVILVSRQNGKTEQLKPYIIRALRAGLRVLHIAQNRDLPRAMFGVVAEGLSSSPELFTRRGGRTIWPRYGAGQEEIILANGGEYRIAASNRGGARGRSIDVLIIDETRELVDDLVMAAAKPTQTAAPDPVTVYLSNAGTDESVVLNGLRERARSGEDPRLAWLEWSAAPDRAPDDREGWAEANPSMGHFPNMERELESAYLASRLEGTIAQFEIEHLCRWMPSIRDPLLDLARWAACAAETLTAPVRPYLGVSMDPNGRRASAVLAWRQPDGTVALRTLFDVVGDPISTDKLGPDLQKAARAHGVVSVGFDPMTDGALAAFFPRKQPITGQQYANASSRFVAAVEGQTLQWRDGAAITTDLGWTTRKDNDEEGSFEAVRGEDRHPITAALAAIRAVWLATAPVPKPAIFRSF